MKFKFDCLYYYVSELDASVAFYQDILGFQVVSRETIATFDIDGVRLELIPTKNKENLLGEGNARL